MNGREWWSNFESKAKAQEWLDSEMPELDDSRLRDPRVVSALTKRQLEVAQAIYAESADRVRRECLGAYNQWGYNSREPRSYEQLVDVGVMRVSYNQLWHSLQISESTIASHVRRIEAALGDADDLGSDYLWHRENRGCVVTPRWPVLLAKQANNRAKEEEWRAWVKSIEAKTMHNRFLHISVSGSYYRQERGLGLNVNFSLIPSREVLEWLADQVEMHFASPDQYVMEPEEGKGFCWGGRAAQKEE